VGFRVAKNELPLPPLAGTAAVIHLKSAAIPAREANGDYIPFNK
jgi:hypothetical protein